MASTWFLSAVCVAFLSATGFSTPALAVDEAGSCPDTVTAQSGDSCVTLATAHGITVSQFLQMNPDVRSCTLQAGVVYCVGTVAAASTAGGGFGPILASSAATTSTSTSTSTLYVTVTETYSSVSASAPATTSRASSSSSPVSAPSSSSSLPHANATTSSVSASASSAPPAQSTMALIPSPDGSDGICGGEYTCLGSPYGDCCSENGYCGNSTEYCGAGCNPAYGICGLCPAPETVTVTAVSTATAVRISAGPTVTSTVTAPPSTVTVTATATRTSSGTPANATPSPVLQGTTRNCARWHQFKATDTCRRLALTNGVNIYQLQNWNPNFDCDDPEDMAGYYICVGVYVAQSPYGK